MVALLVCPGQGAQKVGMGRDLAERFPAARDVFDAVDTALGVRLSRLMWEGPEDELTLTQNAQPAILAHTAAALAVAGPRLLDEVAAAAGHSLGEYSAYVAAGAFSAAAAAMLVRRRGELMYEAGAARPGAMAAVLGLATEQVRLACGDASSDGSIAVAANINAPDQTVISGDPAGVERAGARCRELGARRVVPLKVSGAFHSPLSVNGNISRRSILSSEFRPPPPFPTGFLSDPAATIGATLRSPQGGWGFGTVSMKNARRTPGTVQVPADATGAREIRSSPAAQHDQVVIPTIVESIAVPSAA